MKARERSRAASDTAIVLANLSLVALVLVPAYVVFAAVLDLALGASTGASLGDRLVYYAKDRWWVPLLYLFVAPFISAGLLWLARDRPDAPLRAIAMVVAPLSFLLLFAFLFGSSAPSLPALLRPAIPALLATVLYAALMRIPRRRYEADAGDSEADLARRL